MSILILILTVLNIFLYFNTTGFEFLKDDYQLIVNNARIKTFDSFINSVKTPFFTFPDHPYLHYWRPLTLFSFFVDYKIYGMNPSGFHLTNIIINIFCILMIFTIFMRISGNDILSFLTALFFSVHPSHVEVVSWISGRTDLLGSLFLLLSIFFFILFLTKKKKKFLYYIVLLIFFIMGLLSKESVIMFPLIASLIVPVIVFINKKKEEISVLNAFVLTIPFWLIDIVFFYFHSVFSGINKVLNEVIPHDIPLVIKSIGVYSKMILFPFSGTPYFEMSSLKSNSNLYYIFFLIALLFLIYVLINKEKFPYTFFATIFLILIMPVVNPEIIPSYPQIALRFVYIPTLILGTFLAEMFLQIRNKHFKRGFLILILVIFVLMANKSIVYKKFFKNQNSFYNDINGLTAYHPLDPSLLLPLALSEAQTGNFDKAFDLTNRALKNNTDKRWIDVYENGSLLKANLFIASGKLDEGRRIAEKIKKITSDKEIKYFSNLVIAKYYEKKGNYDEALKHIYISGKIADTPDIHFRTALILGKKGLNREALIQAKKAMKQNPSNIMYARLVNVLESRIKDSGQN